MKWREPEIPERFRKLYERGRNGKAKAAIRCHCLMCCAWEAAEVERCTAMGCPLYELRNKSAQAKTEEPDRTKRRARSLAAGLRPPQLGHVDGHGDRVGGPNTNAIDQGGATIAK